MKKNKELLKMIRKLIEASFVGGRIIEKEVIRAIMILKSLPQSNAIFAMAEYLKGLKRKEREHTMYIETAIPLSSAIVSRMKKIVEKKVQINKVLININPEILGGFKLKIGDEIWDESIMGKIQQIKEAIRG
ncbi:MAG: F0F1 ATP synthase subunit delta [Candidatus Daviesbacteria bacterium]|nr:F0F1 ATP synthase subunit delta [Candidatus Daviesbacteria bacterium]